MILIRRFVFETNSSTSHSLTISHNDVFDTVPVDPDGVVRIDCSGHSFCRGNAWRTNDPLVKIAFFVTYAHYWDRVDQDLLNNVKEAILDNTMAKDVEFINPTGSDLDFQGDFNIPEDKELYRTLFDKNSWMFFLGDEYDEPDGFYDVPVYKS